MHPMTPDDFAWMRRLMLRLDRIIRKRDATDEELDTIRWHFEAFLQEHNQAAQGDGRPAWQDVSAANCKRVQLLEKAREEYASNGAAALKLVPMANGDWSILIDQHRLKLPPQLGMLLRILVDPDVPSPDNLVGWQSRRQVRDALGAASGHTVSDHALTGLIWRLRNALEQQADLHRDFVMVNPSLGLRFALQKKSGEIPPSVSP